MPYIANPLESLALTNSYTHASFITQNSALGTTPATDDTLIIYDLSATALKQLTIANLQASIVSSVTSLSDTTISSIGADEVLKWSGSAWINNTLAEANILPVAGPTFTGVLTVGSAVISEADLELIDDLTAGTVVVSKAVTVDGNKDVGTIRNLTIDGIFTDGNYSFDTSGNVTGLGTIGSGNITSTGTVQGTTITATTAFVPDASDGAALGTAALEFSDLFLADAAVISLGDDDDVTLTHVVDTGILLSSTDRFQFGDAGTFIHQSADGVLTIESDTTVDINGAVVFDGAVTGITTIASGTITIGSLVVAAASITDTSGAITFGNENLSTTGTLAAGTTTIGTLTVAAASLTDSSGAISFGNENLTTTGTLAAGTTTIGTLTVAAASITDSSGALSFGDENLTTTGTLATAAITASGILKTDNTTEATSTTDGSLQTDGGLSVAKDAVFGDDVKLLSDAAVLSFGADAEVTLTHVADDGLLLNTDMQLQFRDSAINIRSDADGDLDINADDELELNSTLIDINGAVDISGILTMSGGTLDMSGEDVDNIRSATFIAEVDAGNGSADIDWGAGQKQYVTLSGNVTLNFVNPDGPCNLMLKVIHSGGGRTVTWDSNPDVKWPAGTAPTLSSSAGTDLVAFYFDGTVYYGSASVAFA